LHGPGTGYNLTCHECPTESTCSEVGFTLDNLPVSRGHFRFSAHSAEIRQCPGLDLCRKGMPCACAGSSAAAVNATSATTSAVTAGDALCAAHSSGPFCTLCEDGYYRKLSSFNSAGTGCLSCTDDGDVVAAMMTVLVIILAIMLTLFVFWRRIVDIVFRTLSRANGTSTHGRGGSSQVSYVWWRLVVMQIWWGGY